VQYRADTPRDAVLEAMARPGETLKRSHKFDVRLVGDWVVKQSLFEGGMGPFKLTVVGNRYRRAWNAAWRLAKYGVPIAAPIAYAEERRGGIVWTNTLITGWLGALPTVEQWAHERIGPENEDEAGAFLDRLARVLQPLESARAYHADLSGKNILTPDGETFYVVDLDGVHLDRRYTERLRRKNQAQLYDSFCDLWPPDVIEPMIARLGAARGWPHDKWFPTVQAAQAERRARQIARWRRQGKASPGQAL
jgi:hypothetical protein